jgi:outer membrane protein OmpA-like peptidoglycan-associated protein
MSGSTSLWATRLRGPALGLTLGAALVIAGPVQAAEKQKSSKAENIGVMSGLVVGAVAGGPLGAVVGAVGGAVIGDRFNRKDVKNAQLTASLSKSEAEKTRLMADLAQAMAHGEQLGQTLDKTLDKTRELEAAIAFRTNDASLSADDIARLKKIGSLAGSLPDVKVRVAGYTDPRGKEEFNAALSQRRADSVAGVLSAAGVPSDRIVIEAHGEHSSTSTDGDLEGYAFERRVTVRIEQGSDGEAVALR